jgi:8-oxo-dGTP pyrophosphatase MutT (NUDIX family)
VGGGLSVGYSIMETAIKESAEEASIPEHLTQKLASVGCVSFFFECELGLSANTEFVFDLELPVDFVPFNADGEVQGFELLSIDECLEKVFSPEFKTTGCPVFIDFLIRHGIVTPENGKSELFTFP